jgi:hypothetical protein
VLIIGWDAQTCLDMRMEEKIEGLGSTTLLTLNLCRGSDDGDQSKIAVPALKKLVGIFNLKGQWDDVEILEFIVACLGHINVGQNGGAVDEEEEGAQEKMGDEEKEDKEDKDEKEEEEEEDDEEDSNEIKNRKEKKQEDDIESDELVRTTFPLWL